MWNHLEGNAAVVDVVVFGRPFGVGVTSTNGITVVMVVSHGWVRIDDVMRWWVFRNRWAVPQCCAMVRDT